MITLRGKGVEVDVVALGARLAAVRTPDRRGVSADITVGPDEYGADTGFHGATVGRFANRIAGGTFAIDGCRYTVPCNEDGVALHGGTDGFDRHPFTPGPVEVGAGGEQSVTLRRTSPAGENGFPGTLDVAVTYTVCCTELTVDYSARTDAPTVVNLTNHAYWNLAGAGSAEHHSFVIPARHYLPVDARMIPTGERVPVDGTPFDLRAPARLGARLREDHPQIVRARGYDHTFVLDRRPDGELVLACHVEEPCSGRTLTVFTDQPGVQLYSGNFLDGATVMRGGRTARQGDAFCLEPQQFPNAPNEPSFPSTVLRPGEEYRSRITLVFGVVQACPEGGRPGPGRAG